MTDVETRDRFGYQWTHFDEMRPEFEMHFKRLLASMNPEDFNQKSVLDAGSGYGRYAFCAEKYGARVVGMDFSEAIKAAREIVRDKGIDLVRGDILRPPFQHGAFDIVMSLGVLHHLPDPYEGFRHLRECVAPGGTMLLWLYSAERRISNATVELLRRLARPFSNETLRAVTLLLAIPDFVTSKLLGLLRYFPGEPSLTKLVPTHFKLYAEFPFSVCWADWFDRLGAPIRHYYESHELEEWLESVGAEGIVVPTDDFGWTVIARFAEIERPVSDNR